eukprot:Clim_evm27s148 gene=Clim_evmTU27s148
MSPGRTRRGEDGDFFDDDPGPLLNETVRRPYHDNFEDEGFDGDDQNGIHLQTFSNGSPRGSGTLRGYQGGSGTSPVTTAAEHPAAALLFDDETPGSWVAKRWKAVGVAITISFLLAALATVTALLLVSENQSKNRYNNGMGPRPSAVQNGDDESSDFRDAPRQGFITQKSYGQSAAATDVPQCSEMAANIMRWSHGNAIDAAVTAALCVGGINAMSSGIGGGGFMVVRTAKGEVKAIDFRETAPGAATQDMYEGKPEESRIGARAMGVPGELAGLQKAHDHYGRLKWKDVVMPVADMLASGFVIGERLGTDLLKHEERIVKSETLAAVYAVNLTAGDEAFSGDQDYDDNNVDKNPTSGSTGGAGGGYSQGCGETGCIGWDGKTRMRTYRKGEVIRLPTLAKTMKIIAEKGADAFYKGELTDIFVEDVQRLGGIITKQDMAEYKALVKTPLESEFMGYRIWTSPPPASGPVLLHALSILEQYEELHPETLDDENSAAFLHPAVEALKFSYALRTKIADPDFADIKEVMLEASSAGSAVAKARKIEPNLTHEPEYYGPHFDMEETPGTTHMSIVGPDGDAVSLTSTVNLIFGAGVMSPGLGVVLNNEMDDFSSPNITNYFGLPPSPANHIAPGKRPLSSSTPVIIEDSSKEVVLVLGAAGGTKITTGVYQVILRCLKFKHSIFSAIEMPRFHHQLVPNTVTVEYGMFHGFDDPDDPDLNLNVDTIDTLSVLQSYNHTVEVLKPAGFLSVIQGVQRHNGRWYAHSDVRKHGQADGW